MRTSVLALSLVLLLSACASAGGSGVEEPGVATGVTPTPSPEPSPAPPPEEDPDPYLHPHRALPESASAYAGELEAIGPRLRRDVTGWLKDADGRLGSRAACDVASGSLRLQRLIKGLVTDDTKARKVLRRLPDGIAHVIRAHIEASRGLRALASPSKPKQAAKYRITPADDPHLLKRIYDRAAERYGVDWQILASLNFVESKFGRFMGPSSAGALGPMQFMPATWDAYGNGGNVMDPRDAVPAAARYLVASGAPGDMRRALYAYNRSYAYVDAILTYARHIRRDSRNYFEYWFWQVFVMTTKGDRQLTEFECRA